MRTLIICCIVFFGWSDTSFLVDNPAIDEKIKGLNFVAPPDPFPKDPMLDVLRVNAEWIAVLPFAYTMQGKTEVHYNASNFQWWGERPEGCEATIKFAKKNGIKVLLKPHIYVPGSWSGYIDFKNEKEWEHWEEQYTTYLMEFAHMAEKHGVEMLCIGNEFKTGIKNRESFWRNLIKECRKVYNGKITYAANWDNYLNVPIWDVVDFVGINAYFPLSDDKTPQIHNLKKAWQPIVSDMRVFFEKYRKPIIFTEFGYLSVDQCAHKTWELEKGVKRRNINEKAQANAISSLLSVFWEEEFWLGGFLWKWFPFMKGHEGYPERDYTIQGKEGQIVVEYFYSRCE